MRARRYLVWGTLEAIRVSAVQDIHSMNSLTNETCHLNSGLLRDAVNPSGANLRKTK